MHDDIINLFIPQPSSFAKASEDTCALPRQPKLQRRLAPFQEVLKYLLYTSLFRSRRATETS